MTELLGPDAVSGPPARLSVPLRLALLTVASIAFLLSIGLIVGLAIAALKDGSLKPNGAIVLVAAVLGTALFGWLSWRLSAHWRRPGRSAYERRYTKMMLALVTAGMPIGLLIGLAGDGQVDSSLLSNGPLDPALAAVAALGLVVTLGGALILYHRTIDDHEQQAYLWANSWAFYFLALALPAIWLLTRGGLVAPIGIGGVMLIMLAAFVVNFTVWAWLKYR